MTVTAKQIHCPYCNATQAPHSDANYACEFCLQPFTLVESQTEETRLMEQIEKWLAQKVGPIHNSANADASSRAFIFQQKVLPELRRDVDRTLEPVSAFAQHSLLKTPVDPRTKAQSPLLEQHRRLADFKKLRVRLASSHVTGFAVSDSDKEALQIMDERLATVLFLSNVASAANRRDPQGYSSARRNLEQLVGELRQSLAVGQKNEPTKRFLGGLVERHSALAELCRILEELTGDNAVAAEPFIERIERQVAALQTSAETIGNCDYDATEAMPLVVGIRAEAESALLLIRWLRAYGLIASSAEIPFKGFVETLLPMLPAGAAELQSEVLELVASSIQVARGGLASRRIDDFSWAESWAEGLRSKKSLGLFGTEERLARLDRFLLPVWVADVLYSRSTGTLLKSGIETRAIAVVDACSPEVGAVTLITQLESEPGLTLESVQLSQGTAVIAAPRSSSHIATSVIEKAVRANPGLLNPKIKLRGIWYFPAAVAHYESKKGLREVATCLNGTVRTMAAAQTQVQVALSIRQQFG